MEVRDYRDFGELVTIDSSGLLQVRSDGNEHVLCWADNGIWIDCMNVNNNDNLFIALYEGSFELWARKSVELYIAKLEWERKDILMALDKNNINLAKTTQYALSPSVQLFNPIEFTHN